MPPAPRVAPPPESEPEPEPETSASNIVELELVKWGLSQEGVDAVLSRSDISLSDLEAMAARRAKLELKGLGLGYRDVMKILKGYAS